MTQQQVPQYNYQGGWQPQPHPFGFPQKSFITTWLLSLLLGGLGIDRFYLGKIGTGILKLVTFGGFGIWTLIDLIITLAGAQKDKHGLPLEGYQQHKKMAWIVTGILLVISLLFGILTLKADTSETVVRSDAASAPSQAAADADDAVEAPAADEASEEPARESKAAKAPEKKAKKAPVSDSKPVEEPATSADENSDDSASNDDAADDSSDVPVEYTSALKSAETYSDMMHMSKRGVYDQLTSEYGEKFSKKAAQYAIDHVHADWNKNALETAKTYQDDMHMSPAAIHDQLTSEYGEKFTESQADYAIKHLKK